MGQGPMGCNVTNRRPVSRSHVSVTTVSWSIDHDAIPLVRKRIGDDYTGSHMRLASTNYVTTTSEPTIVRRHAGLRMHKMM